MKNKSIFLTLANCGIITLALAEKYLNVTEKELDSLTEQGYLSKETIKERIALVRNYSLTEKGEKYIKETYPEVRNIYIGFVKEHDIRLCEFYLERTEDERNSWITRDGITYKYNPLGELKGSLDGGYVDTNGENFFVKALSKESSKKDVERIEEYIKEAGIKNLIYIFY